ncbi:MAG: bacillithiol biosynthesis cysteine-adding enzyme BshC [Chitinophagaceae bacterium]|nr:bacillithiol biosynthesis cysteine-adding enzyme BshC [Chitinophagaceae bacterium]
MSDFTSFPIAYDQTGFFSKLVIDYISQSDRLDEFYAHQPSIEGIKQSIAARKNFNTPRQLLVEVLKEQYAGLPVSEKLQANIENLLNQNTFTITTAHQPNIFTGPLYFIYKILHTAKLAQELNKQLPEHKFVPVYYMGSEDADLDELGYINLGGQKLVWQTKQTGAVGRMKVDKSFLQLINAIEGQIGVLPEGPSLVQIFKQVYTEGKMIQQATLELVNILFSDYGIIVLVPDNAKLKTAYQSVIRKELTEGFSHHLVDETIASLKENYKVQAAGRDLNLFYLIDQNRERIEFINDHYQVNALGLRFSKSEILDELETHPERFSANVILRGGFQETVLPNIAFIGGGGELAYWMELKKVFDAVGIPYPVLILRNSFLVMKRAQLAKMEQLGFGVQDLFKDCLQLLNELVKRQSAADWNILNEINSIKELYGQLQVKAANIDQSLNDHVIALEIKTGKRLKALEQKMFRAERNKFDAAKRQITMLKEALFPNNSLQERTDNFSELFSQYGKSWMDLIYQASPSLKMEFTVLVIE